MRRESFRAIVRDEVATWFESHRDRLDTLLRAVARAMAPALEESIVHDTMVRMGTTEPDDRQLAIMALEEAGEFIARHCRADVNTIDLSDVLLGQLKRARDRLQAAAPPPSPST